MITVYRVVDRYDASHGLFTSETHAQAHINENLLPPMRAQSQKDYDELVARARRHYPTFDLYWAVARPTLWIEPVKLHAESLGFVILNPKFEIWGEVEESIFGWDGRAEVYPTREGAERYRAFQRGAWCSDQMSGVPTDSTFVREIFA